MKTHLWLFLFPTGLILTGVMMSSYLRAEETKKDPVSSPPSVTESISAKVSANSPVSEPSSLPSPAASEGGSQAVSSIFSDEMLKMRDPFQEPVHLEAAKGAKSELESVPVHTLKLVGVLTGSSSRRALILLPSGNTQVVSERAKIGRKGGTVKRILPDMMEVSEKVVNVIGQEENEEIEISLTNMDNKSSTGVDGSK